ncbi:hypothetical protein RF11_04137 [Thelohanellus kitauei]|uniref:Uncharacterized protein n=1 Tax=Thelohanellus kitauei TaxID=669202 RepID=A0A0C2NCH2_THEKT|nr:hypothetical protein RF11_04137 [Thelohanellus kitauei]
MAPIAVFMSKVDSSEWYNSCRRPGVDWKQAVSLVTKGTLQMIDRKVAVATKLKEKLERLNVKPDVFNFHGIVNQESLCVRNIKECPCETQCLLQTTPNVSVGAETKRSRTNNPPIHNQRSTSRPLSGARKPKYNISNTHSFHVF